VLSIAQTIGSFLTPIEQSIRDKVERIEKALKEGDVKIYRGILTGCNEAFIIDAAKRDEILENCAGFDGHDALAEDGIIPHFSSH
jgi:hypothetical protein